MDLHVVVNFKVQKMVIYLEILDSIQIWQLVECVQESKIDSCELFYAFFGIGKRNIN